MYDDLLTFSKMTNLVFFCVISEVTFLVFMRNDIPAKPLHKFWTN